MKTYFVIILGVLTAAMVIASCDERDLFFDSPEVSVIDISDESTAACQTDPFDILETSRDEDELAIKVAYSGGCSDHQFKLIQDSNVNDSDNPELRFTLIHDANGDLCEAYPSEVLKFSIREIIGRELPSSAHIFIRKCQ